MTRSLALALSVALLAAPAQAARRERTDKGIELIASGRTREAISHYQSQIQQFPNDGAAFTGLGVACERAGRTQEAREAYERAIKLDATDVRAMNNLANLLIEGDLDIPRAKRLLKRAIELRPDLAIAWDNMGWAFYKEKNFGQATAHLKRALTLDPRQASAHYHLGFCYLQSNDYARARPHLQNATRLDPSSAKAWMAQGLTLQKLDKKDEAKLAYKQALARVDRRSSVGRELVRLINSLGSAYGSADSLLSSPDSLFAKYTPTPSALPAPFENSGMFNLGVGTLGTPRTPGNLGTPQTPGNRAVAEDRGGSPVPALPGALLQSPPVLAAQTSSGGMTAPPPLGLPASVMAARAARHNAPGASLVDGLTDPTPRQPIAGPTASNVEPRAGSIILSHRSNTSPAPAERPREAAVAPPLAPRTGAALSESSVKQDLVETHLRMATMYEEHGLFQDAVSEGQTVINLAPWSREAGTARELVARLAKREEADSDQRIHGLIKLGEKFHAEHQLEPAVLQFEKVLVLNPRHPIAFKDLAFLNLRANRLEVAYDQVKKALELEPDYQEALLIKGHIEARQRQFRASYDTFKKLTELAREGTAMRQYAVGLSSKMRRFVELE